MSEKTTDILIYGAGGFARETAWLMTSSDGPHKPVAFISDGAKAGESLHGLPVVDLNVAVEEYPNSKACVAVGNSVVRETLTKKLYSAKLKVLALIHSSVKTHSTVSIGVGSIICANNLIMPDVIIKKHVHINLACTIGHDCIIEDYVTISPGVHISGNVHIGKGAFIGTGANFIQGTAEKPLFIAPGSIIGAGACVTTDTEANGLYVGVPAKRKR